MKKILPRIIDKAGNFLLDHEDFKNALSSTFRPKEPIRPSSSLHWIGILLLQTRNIEESIRKERRAVELEPNNYFHLNDLGTLFSKRAFSKRQKPCSSRSLSLAPPEYEFARTTWSYLRKTKVALTKRRARLASPGELVQCRFVKRVLYQSFVAVYYDFALRDASEKI